MILLLLSLLLLLLFTDISVTFQFPMYTIPEPEEKILITNTVLLVKGDNIMTERTFGFDVRTTNMSQLFRPATSREDSMTSYDYAAVFNNDGSEKILVLPPNSSSVSFNFFLNSDLLPEGTEAFSATAVSATGYPSLLPTSTIITITDNDRKETISDFKKYYFVGIS